MPHLLDLPLPYRLWQAPFAADKIAPVLADVDFQRARNVLDVGCGPGTNAAHLGKHDYTGLDLNRSYIRAGRAQPLRRLVVADATYLPVRPGSFDAVLVNSLTHHLDDAGLHRLLDDVRRTLRENAAAHVVDMVDPGRRSTIAFALAHLDRGRHVRSEVAWLGILATYLRKVSVVRYTLRAFGIPLWHMVYFKGVAS